MSENFSEAHKNVYGAVLKARSKAFNDAKDRLLDSEKRFKHTINVEEKTLVFRKKSDLLNHVNNLFFYSLNQAKLKSYNELEEKLTSSDTSKRFYIVDINLQPIEKTDESKIVKTTPSFNYEEQLWQDKKKLAELKERATAASITKSAADDLQKGIGFQQKSIAALEALNAKTRQFKAAQTRERTRIDLLNEEAKILLRISENENADDKLKDIISLDSFFEHLRDVLQNAIHNNDKLSNQLEAFSKDRGLLDEKLRLEEAERKRFLFEVNKGDKVDDFTDEERAKLSLFDARIRNSELLLQNGDEKLSNCAALYAINLDEIKDLHQLLQKVLPHVTEQKREKFFSFTEERNWNYAWFRLRYSTNRTVSNLNSRWRSALNFFNDFSSLYNFIAQLLLRIVLAFLPLGLFVVYGERLLDRLSEIALRFSVLHNHPNLIVILGEFIRHLSPMILQLFGIYGVCKFFHNVFPEIDTIFFIIAAIYTFRIAVHTIAILVMPSSVGQLNQTEDEELGSASLVDQKKQSEKGNREPINTSRIILTIQFVIFSILLTIFGPILVNKFIGETVISKAILWLVLAVLIAVLIWGFFTWKSALIRGLKKTFPEEESKFRDLMIRGLESPFGLVIAPFSFVGIIVFSLIYLFHGKGFVHNIVNRLSGLLNSKSGDQVEASTVDEESSVTEKLPDLYVKLFTPPFDCLPEKCMREWPEHVETFKQSVMTFIDYDEPRNILVLGEQGIGKSTLMSQMYKAFGELATNLEAVVTILEEKIVTPKALIAWLSKVLDIKEDLDKDSLIDRLNDLPKKIIFIDNIHHIFLRQIGGFEALDTFFEIITATDLNHLWVVSCDLHAWNYISRIKAREQHFDVRLKIGKWSMEDLESMVMLRNEVTKFKLNFKEATVASNSDQPTDQNNMRTQIKVIHSARGYFRLLGDVSGGNPSVAMKYWLRSLSKTDDEDRLNVTLFTPPNALESKEVTTDFLFILSAIIQHRVVSISELAKITNLDKNLVEVRVKYLMNKNVLDVDKRGRVSIASLYFCLIKKRLLASNFLYE